MDAGPLGAVLAHQGGWDEILLVVGPLAVIALLLRAANRRVHDQLEQQGPVPEGDGDAPSPPR